jgi:two-component system response regulator YesN
MSAAGQLHISNQLPVDNPRRVVLVADDDEAICDLTARTIAQIGLLPIKAKDGSSALVLAEQYRQVLICAILDIQMPFLNGVEVAHVIRQSAPNLAIILLCGGIPLHLTERINQLRQFTMLYKPFPLWLLREAIERIAETPLTPATNGAIAACEKEGLYHFE